MKKIILFWWVTLLVASGCSITEQQGEKLLVVENQIYYVEDFKNFLSFMRPTITLPMELEVIESFLQDFVDHELLLHHARELGSASSDVTTVGEEVLKIQQMLEKTEFSKISLDEQGLRDMYGEWFNEKRVEIKSLYFSENRVAERQYRNLVRNPDKFEEAMQQYNPEGMKESNFGMGVFSASQLPEEWKNVIFAQNKPGIVGPIEIPNGFIIVKVIRFLDKPSFEEKRDDIALVFMARQRENRREELIQALRKRITMEFFPEKILDNAAFTIQ